MPEKIRTFIAIELSEEALGYFSEVQDAMKREVGPGVKWVSPQHVHLTLKFLGGVAADRIDDLKTALEMAADGFGPMTLTMGGAGQFPPRGRARVIWLAVDEASGQLATLQEAVASAAEPWAEKKEPPRPYHAHVTLARVRDARKAGNVTGAVAEAQQNTGPSF
ncbi:MAG: RNA 2',3'-cyclic phosphodiesterase, partial [Phycisphaerae bacterium]|nr:RNA 2',3'-cyclic phosphodiesterase [Phycisphaerae bacterium]